MNVTIEISEEQAAVLEVQAEALGLTRLLGPPSVTNPKEWASRFHKWAKGHNRTMPFLSDQAISR